MEEMDVFVSKEEVLGIAQKLRAEEEDGEWIVVFYVEERVFGIVPSSTVTTSAGSQKSLNLYQKVKTRYGNDELEVLYFYRGKSNRKLFALKWA